jgi:hypothetical protein
MTIVTKGSAEAKNGSGRARLLSWLKTGGPISTAIFFAPVAVLIFLGLFRWFNLQSPQLFGATISLEVLGLAFTAGSTAGLFLSIKTPRFFHRAEMPGILMLIAPFLKSGMWESEELAGVMRRSWELMSKHVGFVQQQSWTQKYTSKPSNFTMSEAISLILKLLPPVEKHSSTCSRCN